MGEYQWPEIFVNPDKCEPPKEYKRELAIAHACMGWGLCHSGAKLPDNFGWGMIKLAEWADSTEAFTPDVVKRLAEEPRKTLVLPLDKPDACGRMRAEGETDV